jgi:EmrB/QacA subfamily drug resistance transporter
VNNVSDNYKWWVLATVSITTFSAALDTSIIMVSFPRLTEVFNTDASTIVWLVVAFSIAELGLLLTLARVGDIVGRKRVFVSGLSTYTLGLILCSISPNIIVLIISRIIQGAGAAVIITLGSAIVVAVFPQEQQGRAIGILAMLTSVGLIAGPALGGIIVDLLDWQGIFYTRIPIGVITLLMALFIIKEQKEPGARLQLDIGGAVTLLAGASCLLLYLNLGSDWGYGSLSSLLLAAGAIVLFGIFFHLERKAAQPVLDIGLFRNRNFTMAASTNLLQMSASSIGPVLIPFFLINGLLYSQSTSGLVMALIAIPSVILSPLSGWISDRIGNRIPMVFATVCFSVALFLFSRMSIDSTMLHICLILVIFGVGMGVFMAPNQSAVISAAPRRNLATALGVANAMRLLGASIGTALGGTLYAYRQVASQAEMTEEGVFSPAMIEQLSSIESFRYVILLAAFLSITAIVTSALVGKPPVFQDDEPVPS